MATGKVLTVKAGKAAYRKYASDGTLGTVLYPMNATPQTIQPFNLNVNTTDVPDGNSLYPLAVVETGVEAGVNMTFSDFNPQTLADLIGGTYTESGSKTMYTVGEEDVIPATGFTVTLDHTPLTSPVPTICSLDGSPWVKVASAPAVDQFSISAAVVTYSSANAIEEVFATYAYTEALATSVTVPKDIDIPTIQLIVVGENVPSDETRNKFNVNIVIDKVKVTGNMGMPEGSKNPGTWPLTFKALKPRAGQNLGEIVYKQQV